MAFETGINSRQLDYFRRRLLVWRNELASEAMGTAYDGDEESCFMGQVANQVNSHAPFQLQDREQKLIHKIDETLHQVQTGTYGTSKT